MMEELFAAIKSGSVEEVKNILDKPGVSPVVCDKVCQIMCLSMSPS